MLHLDALSYRHPTGASPAVDGVTLRFQPGTLTLLTGPTGCGKSTLLRLCAGLLQRHGGGVLTGSVALVGEDISSLVPSQRVRKLGFVAQNPDDQIVAGTVGDEIAFAAESAGMEVAAIDAAVQHWQRVMGLPDDPDRPTRALSTGQRQRLVAAAALSAGGAVLLLDEPLAHLDPAGAIEFLDRLRAQADSGGTVVVVEHRIEPVLRVADRVVVMAGGRIVADSTANRVDLGGLASLGLSVPPVHALAARLGVTIEQVVERVERLETTTGRASLDPPGGPGTARSLASGRVEPRLPGNILLSLPMTTLRHGNGPPVLRGARLELRAGERVALVGRNGAGKSTLLAALASELGARPDGPARVVAVPHDPDLSLFCPTVGEEIAYAARDRGQPDKTAELAAAFSVGDLLDRAPQALSRGQRLRVAVAAAVAADPGVLLLDEPTAGQDGDQVERMMAALDATLGEGALCFATHDLALATRWATRVVVVDDGALIADASPGELLADGRLERILPLPPWLRLCQRAGTGVIDVDTMVGLLLGVPS